MKCSSYCLFKAVDRAGLYDHTFYCGIVKKKNVCPVVAKTLQFLVEKKYTSKLTVVLTTEIRARLKNINFSIVIDFHFD